MRRFFTAILSFCLLLGCGVNSVGSDSARTATDEKYAAALTASVGTGKTRFASGDSSSLPSATRLNDRNESLSVRLKDRNESLSVRLNDRNENSLVRLNDGTETTKTVSGGTQTTTATGTAKTVSGGTQTTTATAKTTGTAGENALILPGSYEEYLPLDAPTDVSVTADYTAVADGNRIRIYDRAGGVYRSYTHSVNDDETKNVVSKLQFAENGTLYFLDASTRLYALDPAAATFAAERTELVCSSFTVYSDYIYFTNVTAESSSISRVSLATPDISRAEAYKKAIVLSPAVAHDNGILYYTDGGKYLYKLNGANDSQYLMPLSADTTVTSLAVFDDTVYYTDTAGDFYIRRLTGGDLIAQYTGATDADGGGTGGSGGFTALTVCNGYVYAVQNRSVRQYRPASGTVAGGFTDYEICGASASEGRLADATDAALCDDVLVVADRGNMRVTVVDLAADAESGVNAYTGGSSEENESARRVFPVSLSPDFIACDGKTLAVCNADGTAFYDLRSGEAVAAYSAFNSRLVGATAVGGAFYFVTDSNYYYRLTLSDGTDEGGGQVRVESVSRTSSPSARLLTADIYGRLYVARSDGGVYRFDESAFVSLTEGERVATAFAEAKKIAVDYDGNVYCLHGNTLYACADGQAEQTAIPLAGGYVYGQTADTPLTSFALNGVYGGICLVYDGKYLAVSYDSPLSTVRTVAVNGADGDIFGAESAAFSVVRVAAGALTVQFDLAALPGAQVFPYLGYRRETERVALKLGETGDYAIIALFDGADGYTAALVLKRFCVEVPENEFLSPAPEFTDGVGYLTNALPLYKYPYLTALLTVCDLEKNAQVAVLGKIDTLDEPYYYVSYTAADGTTRTGYIPQSYLTVFDGTPPQAETVVVGGDDTGTDAVWRLVFLMLGCACICVLVDFLVLKKPKK